MVAHKDLTGADLHEPKGASSASVNTTYFSNGAGSGAWRKVGSSDLNTAEVFPNGLSLSVVLDDISNPSNVLVAVPGTWTLTSITGVLGGAITAANANLTFYKNGSGVIASQAVSFSGSAEGTNFNITSLANNTFIAGNYIKIVTDGASSTTAPLYLTFVFVRTA